MRLRAPLALLAAFASMMAPPGSRANGRAIRSSADQVERLVQEIERLRGLPPQALGSDHQVAYGTLLLRYLPDDHRLMVAILVTHDELWNKMGEEFARNYRRSTAALSDPAIGGLFDTAGATWMFEEETGKTLLFYTYPLETPATVISRDIDRLSDVVPAWVLRWITIVADIAQGRAPPPTHPVTIRNDPYADQM